MGALCSACAVCCFKENNSDVKVIQNSKSLFSAKLEEEK
jgi:hypothetical protein